MLQPQADLLNVNLNPPSSIDEGLNTYIHRLCKNIGLFAMIIIIEVAYMIKQLW